MFGIRHSEISPKNSRVARWVATQRRMPHEHIRPTRSRSTDRARIVRIRIICCEVVTKRSWSSDTAYVSCSTQSPSLIFVRSSVRPSVRSFVRSFAYSSTSSIHSVGHLIHLIRWLMLAASAKEEGWWNCSALLAYIQDPIARQLNCSLAGAFHSVTPVAGKTSPRHLRRSARFPRSSRRENGKDRVAEHLVFLDNDGMLTHGGVPTHVSCRRGPSVLYWIWLEPEAKTRGLARRDLSGTGGGVLP